MSVRENHSPKLHRSNASYNAIKYGMEVRRVVPYSTAPCFKEFCHFEMNSDELLIRIPVNCLKVCSLI